MSNKIIKIKRIFFVILVNISFAFTFCNADIYKEIQVEGNERLSVETVIMFSEINIEKKLTAEDLNNSIKKLYETNYFKDIKIYSSNKILKMN